jgi:hypothetical protein
MEYRLLGSSGAAVLSNFTGWQLQKAVDIAEFRGRPPARPSAAAASAAAGSRRPL